MILLLGLIFGLLLCWFAFWCIGAVWRLTEALAQGIVGGLSYTFAIFFGLCEAACAFGHWARRTDVAFGQHAHAFWWSYSYWAQRRFIASQLRQRRKERHS